jgi:hypothetical protein
VSSCGPAEPFRGLRKVFIDYHWEMLFLNGNLCNFKKTKESEIKYTQEGINHHQLSGQGVRMRSRGGLKKAKDSYEDAE